VDNADDYAGIYRYGEKTFVLTSKDNRIFLDFESATIPMHPLTPDSFIVPHPAFEMFALHLEREHDRVTGAGWGGERYVREGLGDETAVESPTEWDAYPGHYRSHNPWFNNFRVVLRKGALIFVHPLGEEEPLHPIEPGLFRIGDDPRSPEFIRFEVVVNGRARKANLSGGVYSRIFTP
jgi:hypothetical protein